MSQAKNKRILIFNVNWLGDVLFSTAALRNIRRNFPNSFIACIIPGRCYHILKENPHLDELIIFDEQDRHRGLIGKFKFVRMLKSRKFDMVFLLHRSLTRALICRLSDIPERVGYALKKRGFLLTKKIPHPSQNTMHRIDYYLNIIEKAGLKVEDRYLEFFFSDKDIDAAEDFLNKEHIAKDDFLVAINPGGNWNLKRWPKETWAALADRLISELGAKIIITGSPQDMQLALSIKKSMRQVPVVACGRLNLKALGALCKRLDLFIAADTGPLHIANAVGTKRIIALFGPTHPDITGPYPAHNVVILSKDVGCKIPCYAVRCKDNRCMKAITVEDVFAQVHR